MMGLTPMRGRSKGAEGIVNHMEHGTRHGGPEDYYQQGGHAASCWFGSGCAVLGVVSGAPVEREDLLRSLDNLSSRNTPLVRARSPNRVRAFDLTFSAPKSVSVSWGLADPKLSALIEAAHDVAVRTAMKHIETRYAIASRGRGELGVGGRLEVLTEGGKTAAALYRHGTSREGDPDLHTHAVLLSVVQRRDGSVVSLNSRELYDRQFEAGAVYRTALAAELMRAGFEIERDRDAFRILGIEAGLCELQSKRRAQIEAVLAAKGWHGATASERVALATRRGPQEIPPGPDERRQFWRAEARASGFDVGEIARAAGAPQRVRDRFTDEEVKQLARDLVARESHFTLHEFRKQVAVAAQGLLGAAAIVPEQERLQRVLDLVPVGRDRQQRERFTTRAQLALEERVVEAARALHARPAHRVEAASADAAIAALEWRQGFPMSGEQRRAVQHITLGPDLALVRGGAGTGKSTLLKPAVAAWEAAGYRVRGTAISGKVAADMQDNIQDTDTLAGLLWNCQDQEGRAARDPISSKDIVVVDESGMVGTAQLAALLTAIQAAGAKLVLVGDERQLQSIDAGGGFVRLEHEFGNAELTEIYRQRVAWHKASVAQAAEGYVGPMLRAFHEHGQLHIAQTRAEQVERVTAEYVRRADYARTDACIVICNTRRDAKDVALQVRRHRKQQGELMTPAVSFQSYEGEAMEVAAGDLVMTKRRDKAMGLENGQLWRVVGVEGQQITLADGKNGPGSRTVTVDVGEYPYFRFGYAVTTHSAQGATVDRAVLMPGGRMQDLHATYVQVSRSREDTQFVVLQDQIDDALERLPPPQALVELAALSGAAESASARECLEAAFAAGSISEKERMEASLDALAGAWSEDRKKSFASDLFRLTPKGEGKTVIWGTPPAKPAYAAPRPAPKRPRRPRPSL